jgi:CheY-specific phosphatase CheX
MGNVLVGGNQNTGLVFENNFSNIVRELVHETIGLDLDVENATLKAESKYPSFITGMMVFQGDTDKDILLTITVSKMAAAKIVVSLLDLKYDELDGPQVYDAIKELTNMISGKMKSAIKATGKHYNLSTPICFIGKNHFIGHNTRPKSIIKKFKHKKFEMLAGLFFL